MVVVSIWRSNTDTTLRGVSFKVGPEEAKKAAENLLEGWGRKYALNIEGRYYPPKEVILELLRLKFKENGETLTRMDFTTMDAVRILRRLGFKIVSREKKTPLEKRNYPVFRACYLSEETA